MADKIVILGNGFDLRHFLPTKYNHLITILREIENYDFSDSEVSFSDLFNEDFKQYKDHIVRVICNDGREYVGEPTIFRDHDATSLPGSDCISFYESNTYRVADFFRAEIKDIVVICKQEAQVA